MERQNKKIGTLKLEQNEADSLVDYMEQLNDEKINRLIDFVEKLKNQHTYSQN